MRVRYLTSRDDLKMCWDVIHEVAVVAERLRGTERTGYGGSATSSSGSRASAEEARRKLGVVARELLDDVQSSRSWFTKMCQRDVVWVFEDVLRPRIDGQIKGMGNSHAPISVAPKINKGSIKGGQVHAHAITSPVTPPPCCYGLFLATSVGIEIDEPPNSNDDVKRILRQILNRWTVWTAERAAVGFLILLNAFCQKHRIGKSDRRSEDSRVEETLSEIAEMLLGKMVESSRGSPGWSWETEGLIGWDVLLTRLPWALVKPMLRRAVDVLDQILPGKEAQSHGWVRSTGLKGVERVVECVVRCFKEFEHRKSLSTEDVEDFQSVAGVCTERVIQLLDKIAVSGQVN